MNENSDISMPFEHLSYQTAELGALVRMLSASEGTFSLSIVSCNSPALREYLIEKLDLPSLEVVRITEDVDDVFDFVTQRVPQSSPGAIFIVDLEKILPSDQKEHKILRGINAARESWQSEYSCPIVFWLPEYALTLFSNQARDVWSWLSHRFEFVSEQATAMTGTQDAYAGNISVAANLDIDQKQFRIAELQQRIEDAGDAPKPQLIQHVLVWLNELACIYYIIGNLSEAEKLHEESIEIKKKFGKPAEDMANDYGNLGLIYETRGDLDKAEEMLLKALDINETLGILERMATNYGNLGVIYQMRGDLDNAEEMLSKALDINEKLGSLEKMASNYGNWGVIYQKRGDLDKAEEMYLKTLEIEEKLGKLEGIAISYGNLGMVYEERGELGRAREYCEKSLDLYQRIGMSHMAEKMKGLLGGIGGQL